MEYTQGWKDPNQAFDPLAAGVYRHDYFGEEAESKIAAIWTPDVTIANQIDEPRSRSVALSISADGSISLIRQLDADFRISVDLAAFPFDRQNIDFVFTAPRYIRERPDLRGRRSRSRNLGHRRPDLDLGLAAGAAILRADPFYGWNAKPFVRATVTATVSREWPRYLLRIFIPFAAVVSVSLFILWAPEKVKVDHAGITYSALLALAALSFTFESSFSRIDVGEFADRLHDLARLFLPRADAARASRAATCGLPRHQAQRLSDRGNPSQRPLHPAGDLHADLHLLGRALSVMML